MNPACGSCGPNILILDQNITPGLFESLRSLAYKHQIEWVNEPENRLGLYPGMPDERIIEIATDLNAVVVTYNGAHFEDYPSLIKVPGANQKDSRYVLDKKARFILEKLADRGFKQYREVLNSI